MLTRASYFENKMADNEEERGLMDVAVKFRFLL